MKSKYNLRNKNKKDNIDKDNRKRKLNRIIDSDSESEKKYKINESESETEEEDDFIVQDQEPLIIDFGKLFSNILGAENEGEGGEGGEGGEENSNQKYLNSLSCEQKKILLEKEEKILKPISDNDIPLRYKILNMKLDDITMSFILSKVVQFEKMNPMFGAPEYYKLKKYLDGFVSVPFGEYKKIAVSKDDGNEKIKDFLCRLEYNMTVDIYGQYKAKNSILQVMATWISNPKKTGNVIGLHGFPGVGKTSIGKAFAKSLNIPVVFIPLGGMSSGVTLSGSDYVYEGSSWGKIIESLISSKCMNPIFFFDELDKISDTKEGVDLINLLIHLTDPTQNYEYSDKYFSGIKFDLSRCFFIFSFNDKDKIHPVLRDRINLIKMDSFTVKDKVNIALNYSLSKITSNVGLNSNLFNIPRETLSYIAYNYCQKEKGVRRMEQCLKTIIMKINLFYLSGDYTTLQVDLKSRMEFVFPITITKNVAAKLLDPVYKDDLPYEVQSMYI